MAIVILTPNATPLYYFDGCRWEVEYSMGSLVGNSGFAVRIKRVRLCVRAQCPKQNNSQLVKQVEYSVYLLEHESGSYLNSLLKTTSNLHSPPIFNVFSICCENRLFFWVSW